MTKVEQANRHIQAEKSGVNQAFKPLKHFSAEIGWINDPNGFVHFRGEYHLFYQFNPYDSAWGPMHWGHAKSRDLLNWEHLPVALAPDQAYDKDGCYSGSAIVKDDVLWLMYTGNIVNADGSISQVQNMAFSTDGIHFEKIEQNPVATANLLPKELIANDFRDPKIFEKDGRYYAVVATRREDAGCIVLLGSDDLLNWEFESIFLRGQPHQGGVWECPDYFAVEGQEYLVLSPMKHQQEGNDYLNINSNIIAKGHVDWDRKAFVPESFKEIDHGHDFYAAHTTEGPDGERVMIAWMHTWGRKLVPHEQGHRWQGQMSLPRLLQKREKALFQVLPENVLKAFPAIEPGQAFSIGAISLSLSGSQSWRLGNPGDYLEFGYDAERQEVFVDRSHLNIQQPGEEAWSTTRRAVSVGAQELLVIVDRSSLELFVNGGQETLSSTFYVEGDHSLMTP